MRNHSTGARRVRRAPAPASRPRDRSDTGLREDIRRAVAKAAAGKRLDLAPPAPWYPLTEALIRCDPRGWDKWCRLTWQLRPRLRGAVETMSDAAAARHLLDYPYGIAMLAELDDTAREMLGVVREMVAELGAIGYRKNIEGTFLVEDGARRPISPEQWRAIAEHSVIPTWPVLRDVFYFRFADGGALRMIEGLRFSGAIFRGSPRVGDRFAVPAPRQKPPPRRPGGSTPDPLWQQIEKDAVDRTTRKMMALTSMRRAASHTPRGSSTISFSRIT
jgi:hypothetical protein